MLQMGVYSEYENAVAQAQALQTRGAGGYILEDTVYDNEVTFKVCLKKEQIDKFVSDVTELTCGRAIIKNEEKK